MQLFYGCLWRRWNLAFCPGRPLRGGDWLAKGFRGGWSREGGSLLPSLRRSNRFYWGRNTLADRAGMRQILGCAGPYTKTT
ncbi:hypothetical protein MBLL_00807 (plasmid) [Methylobacterium bullatum]|uniref:Uncharacterized protein n=1 Tax=Methylobacterium bullatum TaxID=570505 RepID=A0A679JJR0_9HYPH|nr:hypothetical protein MBLL_00807 [Methylobacterium bullatum]